MCACVCAQSFLLPGQKQPRAFFIHVYTHPQSHFYSVSQTSPLSNIPSSWTSSSHPSRPSPSFSATPCRHLPSNLPWCLLSVHAASPDHAISSLCFSSTLKPYCDLLGSFKSPSTHSVVLSTQQMLIHTCVWWMDSTPTALSLAFSPQPCQLSCMSPDP